MLLLCSWFVVEITAISLETLCFLTVVVPGLLHPYSLYSTFVHLDSSSLRTFFFQEKYA